MASDAVLVELVLERVSRSAGAGALGAAALDHEVLDDPVEGEAVVEAFARELAEVLDGLGRILVEELDVDLPGGRVQGGAGHGEVAYSNVGGDRPVAQ
jgi:hypothetical protein